MRSILRSKGRNILSECTRRCSSVKEIHPPTGEVTFSFYEAYDKKTVEVKGKLGRKLLHVALDHGVDIEGVCGGELACSTCHVIVDKDLYDILPAKKENEADMLDLTTGQQPT